MDTKIIQSFWSKPFNKSYNLNNTDRSKGGWLCRSLSYMSIALSCLQLKKFYKNVVLFTDKNGKYVLIDVLKLPYDEVIVKLDDINEYDEDLWAIGKLYTYSLQDEPFLHVDNDVFIWEPFEQKLFDYPLIVQNLEKQSPFYENLSKEIKGNFPFIIEDMNEYLENTGVVQGYSGINAGIIGGNDVCFFKEYTKKAFEFINLNYKKLNKINVGWFNIIYEQSLFYCIAKNKELKINCLFEDTTNYFEAAAMLYLIPHYKYFHLLGEYKKNIFVNEIIYMLLLMEYPEYFYLIIDYLDIQL